MPAYEPKANWNYAVTAEEITITPINQGPYSIERLIVYSKTGRLIDIYEGKSFKMPNEDVVVQVVYNVNFDLVEYRIQIAPSLAHNGHLHSPIADKDFAFRGDTITITPLHEDACTLTSLTIYDEDGDLIEEVGGNSFCMPDRNVIVQANYSMVSIDPPEFVYIPFSDVDYNNPYYDDIIWAYENGVSKGYSDGTFGYGRLCTRGDMIMFLWNYKGRPTPSYRSKSPFSDVPKDHVYYKAILWAYQSSITKGYSDGTFGLNNKLLKGDAIRFLWNMSGQPESKTVSKTPFKDVPKTHTHYKAILWGCQNGIMQPATKNVFGVNEELNRENGIQTLFILHNK